MFYSKLLLSKNGALGIVWMAAHCHKKLKKDQVQQTDISSSVDKILEDEVPVVTHRILAFLLLGIVRIYSKKVEYLFHDCHETLNRLCGLKTGKGIPAGAVVSRTCYHSIALPKRFELDTFDLDLLEDQDVSGGNVRSHKQDTLADGRRKESSTSGLMYKDSLQHLQEKNPSTVVHSAARTPPRDVFGPCHVDQALFVSPFESRNIYLDGVEVLRGTRFSLEDHLDQMLLNETEGEQMLNKLADEDMRTTFQGPTHMESEFVLSPSKNRSYLLPSLEILNGIGFVLEDRLEPMVLDEAEKEQLNDSSSNGNIIPNFRGPIQDMEFESVGYISPKGSDSIASLATLNECGHFLEQFPNLKMLNEAERGQGHDRPSDKEHVEPISTQLDFQEGEHHDITRSVDRAKHVSVKMKQLEMITPENIKCQMPKSFRVFMPPDSKLPASSVGAPDVLMVQTPGRKESAKILKKRKILLDLTTVVPNKVFKKWIDDPTDLKRGGRKLPHTLLDALRARKFAHVPQSFLEPLIPGLGYLECQKSCLRAIKSVELSSGQDVAKSSVTYGTQEQIPEVRSPVTEKLPGLTPDVRSPEKFPDQAPIAPRTPLAHLNPWRSQEAEAVADSDILEPATSFESIKKWPSSSEPLELGILFQEETSSFEGDSLDKDTYSARTRMTSGYLSMKFQDKKRRNEKEVLNLTHLLAGKSKKESARLFYEILVLKTRDCIDVQQETAYHDILLREGPKLRQVSDN